MLPAETWYGLLFVITLRYFLIAGGAYLIWYKVKRHKIAYKKIQPRFPLTKDYRREILYDAYFEKVKSKRPDVAGQPLDEVSG
jgi:hypothetical protein